jgi:hypothetical protein
MSNFNHLWNDLPDEERKRLMPHMIESQVLHIEQCKAHAVVAHKRYMKELNDWANNLRKLLIK